MSHFKVNDEVDLIAYEQWTVEELVINAWQRKGGDKIGFKSREDHTLDNVSSRLSQINTGVEKKMPTTPSKKQKRFYDKVCYIIIGKDQRWDLLVIEYKAANKLTPDVVLDKMHDMEIEAIIQRVKLSTNKGKKKKEMAENAIAMIVTQTYDYMIDQGLSYGYVCKRPM